MNHDQLLKSMDFMMNVQGSMVIQMYGNILLNYLTTFHLLLLLKIKYYIKYEKFFCLHGGLSP